MKSNLLPDEIIRSSRKTLSISIDGRGRLIVRAPKRCDDERIFAFLAEKEGWIRKKQAERRLTALPLPPENLEGYAFPLFGERTEIFLYGGKKVLFERGRLYLPEKNARAKLVQWLKGETKRVLERETEAFAATMGTSFASISISSARTRWGSCSKENALRYTFRLLYCPIEIIRYVVVHELAHTRHKNHSPRFWQEVERYMPDWKIRRKWLKAHGSLMELF